MFTVWDQERWEKVRRRMWVSYGDLEEKNPSTALAVLNATGGQKEGSAGPAAATGASQGQGVSSSNIPLPSTASTTTQQATGTIPVGRFAGMGVPT